MVKICGEGIWVQFDETAICNRKLIPDPYSTLDIKSNAQWLAEDVEEGSYRNFVLKLVSSSKVPTTLDMFDEHVVPRSIIVIDGYPSCPGVIAKFGSCHKMK